jgi:hypothetical protein
MERTIPKHTADPILTGNDVNLSSLEMVVLKLGGPEK